METSYYVYKLSNPVTNVPFYIGVAKISKYCPIGYRPKKHIQEAISFRDRNKIGKGANLHKLQTILLIIKNGDSPKIEIVLENLSKERALLEERNLIKEIGRRDIGSGPLTNLTDGGEGGFNMSPEGRARIAEAVRSRPNKNKGIKLGPYSEERKNAAKEGQRKRRESGVPNKKLKDREPLSEKHKANLSASLKGRPSPMKGRPSPFKGTKTGPMSEESKAKMRGRISPYKGIPNGKKGMTYEELYGPEKAKELLEIRRQAKINYWKIKKDISQNAPKT